MHKSDRDSRAVARLANVAAGSAPAGLSRAAATLRDVLTRDGSAPREPDLQRALEALAAALEAACGSAALRLDMLSVLRGEEALHPAHRRPNVAGALRDKRRVLGRDPVEADFPAGHAAPLLALAYWGGVAAWSAGAAARTQRPKGFWTDRANQVDALRRFAAEHPGQPITAATLAAGGLFALARSLDAAELDAVCRETGCDRGLRRRANAWWTVERTIDAYVALCRAQGATLSAHALTMIGGEASSLRAYARRHFPTFQAFQQAARAQHRDLRLATRPTASDGTILDSWSEVVVYQAIRRVLPDAEVAAHVLLPGEGRRSTDFVVDGRASVEVLGLSLAEMAAPRTSRQRKYARDWRIKAARYVALGLSPVVVEPADVHDPARLAACMTQLAAALRRTPVQPPAATPAAITVRGKGAWTFEALCAAVAQVAAGSCVLPTYGALTAAGFGHACNMLRRPGMRARVAAELGLADQTGRNRWTPDRVVAELADLVCRHGSYPSRAALIRAGEAALASACGRLWGGREAALRQAVETRAGVAVRPPRAPNGSMKTLQQAAAALRPLAQRLGRMPRREEAAAAGLLTAWTVASRRWGVAAVARLLGVPTVRSAPPAATPTRAAGRGRKAA
jgi:hypothetical protein